MGRLTASKSGEIASFKTPYATDIKSLKVHFSPKQMGSGDPSPENIREIVGWDGVEGYHSGKNMAHIVGYSAKNSISTSPSDRSLSNSYGTTISTINFLLPDTELIVTQDSYTTEYNANNFHNGYFAVIIDNLIFGKRYNISFKINNIINNPLNVELEDIKICNSKGNEIGNPIVVSNKIIFKNVIWSQNTGAPNRKLIEVRNCGMSFTLSEFMVTPVEDEDFKYESYKGNNISSSWTKNLLNINHSIFTYSGCQRNSDGSITLNSSNGAGWTDDSALVPFALEKGTYTISWRGLTDSDIAAVNLRISSDGYTNNIRFVNGTGTFTLNEDCNIKFKFSTSTYPVTGYVQLELGSEPTEYQPYVGTVYGGYVDLITGELVQEWGYISEIWGNLTFSANLETHIRKYLGFEQNKGNRNKGQCLTNIAGKWFINNSSDTLHFYLNEKGFTFYVIMPNDTSDDTLIEFVYPLDEPITYQLSPQQLQAFAGQNNLWSNADSVEISYELIDTPDIQRAKKRIILNQPHIETVEGDIISFNTDMRAPLKECKVSFLPVQEGQGDPSPDNIRNISGWNGIEINGCGKNLFDISIMNERGLTVTGDTFIGTATQMRLGNKSSAIKTPCFIPKDTPFTISCTTFCDGVNTSGGGWAIIFETETGETLERPWYTRNNEVTPTYHTGTLVSENNIVSFFFTYYNYSSTNTWTVSNFQIEVGSTPTEYEPYNGNIVLLDWTDEAGIIYGGYIDLVNGELVATHKIIVDNGQENVWATYYPSHQIHFTRVISDKKTKLNTSISNFFKNANNTYFWDRKEYSVFGDHNTLPRIYVNAPYEMPNGVTEWREWLSNNPLQICYELAEPIHYSLTPQQILTLKQTNNIYSNTNGNIEVKYWKH